MAVTDASVPPPSSVSLKVRTYSPITALREALSRTWLTKLGYLLARGAFKELRDKLDPNKSNGGVLLGLNGVVVKSHGGISAEGFAYAVDVGYETVHYDLLTKINRMLNRDGGALAKAQTAQEAVS